MKYAVLVIIAAMLSAEGITERVVRVGAFNYYPGIFKDSDGSIRGFYVDALSHIASNEKWRIEYVFGTWAEGLARVRSGEVDILTSVAYAPDRAQYLTYGKEPLLTVWSEVYTLPDSSIRDLFGLTGMTVAVMSNDHNAAIFSNRAAMFDLHCRYLLCGNFEDVFTAVKERKADAGVVNSTFGSARRFAYGLSDTGIMLNPFYIYFASAKDRSIDVLTVLDGYLKRWKHEPDSLFKRYKYAWTHREDAFPMMPGWIKRMIVIGIVIIFALTVIALMFRREVARTAKRLSRIDEHTLLVNEMNERLNNDRSLLEIVSCAAEGLIRIHRFDSVTVALKQKDGSGDYIESFYTSIPREPLAMLEKEGVMFSGIRIPLVAGTFYAGLYAEKRTVEFTDFTGMLAAMTPVLAGDERAARAVLTQLMPGSMMLVPLTAGDAVIGHLVLLGARSISPEEKRAVGSFAGRIASIIDRKRLETMLRENEHAIRKEQAFTARLMATSPIGIVVLSPAGVIEFANRRAEDILGLIPSAIAGVRYDDPAWRITSVDGSIFPNDQLPFVRALTTKRPVFDVRHAISDGSVRRILSVNAMPLLTEDGSVERVITTIEDFTDRERTERVLLEHIRLVQFAAGHTMAELLEETLNAAEMITGSAVGFYHFVDDDERSLTLQQWSTRTKRDFCTAKGHGLHYPMSDAGVWVDCVAARAPVIHNDYASLAHKKGLPPGHAPIIRELVVPVIRNGHIVAILGVGNKPSDYDADDVAVISRLADIAWDVADRKRAEERLRDSEERNRTLLNAIPDMLFVFDREGTFLDARTADVYRLFMKPSEFMGKRIRDVFPEPLAALTMTVIETVAKTEMLQSYEYELPMSDGTHFFEARIMPYGGGRFLAIVQDISGRKWEEAERQRQNERLIQSDKLIALGELTAGLAHEINQPLTAITLGISNAVLLSKGEISSEKLREKLARITENVGRITSLMEHVRTFSREQASVSGAVFDVRDAVDGALSMVRVQYESKAITFEIACEDGLTVYGNRYRLEQVLLNMLSNAKDAFEAHAGGARLISIRAVRDDAYVRLSVRDNGPGIPEEHRSRIFQPFFTTKPVSKGTGLGLSVSYGIIRDMGGTIELESEVGAFTEFIVQLPRVESAVH